MKINLNTQVEVTLNELGVKCITDQDEELNIPPQYRRKPAVGEVWKGGLWELAQLFGHTMGNGSPLPFASTDIDFTELPDLGNVEPTLTYYWKEKDQEFTYALNGKSQRWGYKGQLPNWVPGCTSHAGVRTLSSHWARQNVREIGFYVMPDDAPIRQYRIQQDTPGEFAISSEGMPEVKGDILFLREFMTNPTPPSPVMRLEEPRQDMDVGVELI